MTKRTQNETRLMYEEAIRQNIANKNWPKLSEVMTVAEKVGVTKRLRVRGWHCIGEYEHGRGNFPAAIVAFNSARSLDLDHPGHFRGFLKSLENFFAEFEEKFSSEDLTLLGMPVQSLVNFYSVHRGQRDANLDKARRLLERIRLASQIAPSRLETPATHKVDMIYSALYSPNMTPEEVRAEFARVFVPLIREEYRKRMKEKNRRKPATSGGKPPKPPKDQDDDEGEKNEDNKKTKRRK